MSVSRKQGTLVQSSFGLREFRAFGLRVYSKPHKVGNRIKAK